MHANETCKTLFAFGAAVVTLVVLLMIMNLIPAVVRKDTLREYGSIEQVRSRLSMRRIYIPSYFPDGVAWPPSKILAQDSPFPALVLEFKRTGKGDLGLIISQARGGTIRTDNTLKIAAIREEIPYVMRGGRAVLTVGECADGGPCSMIAWNEDGYDITAAMRADPFELVKIVVSMRP